MSDHQVAEEPDPHPYLRALHELDILYRREILALYQDKESVTKSTIRLFENIAAIINPVLHGTDAKGNPLFPTERPEPEFTAQVTVVICQFQVAITGNICATPAISNSEVCVVHAKFKCFHCGEQAVRECGRPIGSQSVCSTTLCTDHDHHH